MEDIIDSVKTDSIKVVVDGIKDAAASGDYSTAIQTVLDKSIEMGMNLVKNILLAIIVYIILHWLIGKINIIVAKALEKKDTDPSLASFLKSLVNIVLNFSLIIVIVGILGIETSSFVALFASAGVAIGMALSGTLQNFAGGVMIMFFKPFKVGDFIEAQSIMGIVKEIQIFNTIVLTTDNKVIIVPNGGLSTGIITNYSRENKRRVDFEFSIAYGDDYDKAKSVLYSIIQQNPKVLKSEEDPAPFIALTKLDSSSVNIVVRVWALPQDYWSVYFDINESVYKEFAKQGLNIPYPQMDVHVHQA
ncbi:MAG: mechanosensitive ion channel [Paludibacteraceae bacterium]|nr:mechanosensitive ion channel [Paludibacteraceae bacterium]MBR2260827.1 mechanosensitive ion channel [Paludibacteraceae bacterium]MEE3484989.1 mechanosensitive ion channel domain-containing protein [Bacteroidales bacterium]